MSEPYNRDKPNVVNLNIDNNPIPRYVNNENSIKSYGDIHDYQTEFGKYTKNKIFERDIPYLSDIRAKSQSTYEKFGNSLVKLGVISATGFVEAFNIPTIGLGTALTERRLSGFWDNKVSRLMQHIRNKSEELYPNYYTEEEAEMPFYEALYKYPANFWFDKFMKTTGYTVGMLTSGAAMGAVLRRLTGVAKYRAMGKYANDLAKTTLSNVDKKKMLLKMYPGLNNPERLSALASTIQAKNSFVNISTMAIAAMSEGVLEALHYVDTMKEAHPYMSNEDLRKTGNFVWLLNLPLLWGSNYVQFRNILMKNFKGQLPFNKVVANGVVKDLASLTKKDLISGGIRQAEKGLTRQAFGQLGKVMAVEGMYELMGQGAIRRAARVMNELYEDNFSLPNMLDALGKGYKETFTTAEGWEEGFLGALTALMPFGGANSGFMKLINHSKIAKGNTQAIIDHLNDVDGFKGKFVELYNNNNFQNNLSKQSEGGIENQFKQYLNNELALANDVGLFSALGRTDILKERYQAIKSLENISEFIDILGIDVNSIKDMQELNNVIDGIVNRISEYELLVDNVNDVFAGLKDKDVDYRHVIRNILLNKVISEKYATTKHAEIVSRIQNANISDVNISASIIADITTLYGAKSIEEIKDVLDKISKDSKDGKYHIFESGVLSDFIGDNLGLLTEAVSNKLHYENVYDSILTKEGQEQFKVEFVKAGLEKVLNAKREEIDIFMLQKDEIKKNYEKGGKDIIKDMIEALENLRDFHKDKNFINEMNKLIQEVKDFGNNIYKEILNENLIKEQKKEALEVEKLIDEYLFNVPDVITQKDIIDFNKRTNNNLISDQHKAKKKSLQGIMAKRFLDRFLNEQNFEIIKEGKDENIIKDLLENSDFIDSVLNAFPDIVNRNKDIVNKYKEIINELRIKKDTDSFGFTTLDHHVFDSLQMIVDVNPKTNNLHIQMADDPINLNSYFKKASKKAFDVLERFFEIIDNNQAELKETNKNNPTELADYLNNLKEAYEKHKPKETETWRSKIDDTSKGNKMNYFLQELKHSDKSIQSLLNEITDNANYNINSIRVLITEAVKELERIEKSLKSSEAIEEIRNIITKMLEHSDALHHQYYEIYDGILNSKSENELNNFLNKYDFSDTNFKKILLEAYMKIQKESSGEVAYLGKEKKFLIPLLENYINNLNKKESDPSNWKDSIEENANPLLSLIKNSNEKINVILNKFRDQEVSNFEDRYDTFVDAKGRLFGIAENLKNENVANEIYEIIDEIKKYESEYLDIFSKMHDNILEQSSQNEVFDFLNTYDFSKQYNIEILDEVYNRLTDYYANENSPFNKKAKEILMFVIEYKSALERKDGDPGTIESIEFSKEIIDEIKKEFAIVDHETANTFNYDAKKVAEKIRNEEPLTEEEADTHNRLMNLQKGDELKAKINIDFVSNNNNTGKSDFAVALERYKNSNKTYQDLLDFVGNLPFLLTDNKGENVGATLQSHQYQQDVINEAETHTTGKKSVYEKILKEQNPTLLIRMRLFEQAILENINEISENIDSPEKLNEIFDKYTIDLVVDKTTDVQPFESDKSNYVSDMVSNKFDIDIGYVNEKIDNFGNIEARDFNYISYKANQVSKRLKDGGKFFYIKPIDERVMERYTPGAMVIKQKNGMPMLVFGKLKNAIKSGKSNERNIEGYIINPIFSLLDFKSTEKKFLDKQKVKGKMVYRTDVQPKINSIKNYFHFSDFFPVLKNIKDNRSDFENNISTYKNFSSFYTLTRDQSVVNYKGIVTKVGENFARYNLISIKTKDSNNNPVVDLFITKHIKNKDGVTKTVYEHVTPDYNNKSIQEKVLNENSFKNTIREKILDANVTLQGDRLAELHSESHSRYETIIGTIFNSLEGNYKAVKFDRHDNKGNKIGEDVANNLNPEGKYPFTLTIKLKEDLSSVEGRDSKEAQIPKVKQKETKKSKDDEIIKESLEGTESIPSTEERAKEQPIKKKKDEDQDSKNIDFDFFRSDIILDTSFDSKYSEKINVKLDKKESFNNFYNLVNKRYKKIYGKKIKIVPREKVSKILGKEVHENVNGFWHNNEVYVIEDAKSKDALVHEFLHPFVEILSNENKELFNNLLNEASESYKKLFENIKEVYKNEDVAKKELLVYAIQSEINKVSANRKTKSIYVEFIEWLKSFFKDGLKNIALFMGSKRFDYLNKDMTLEDIAKYQYYSNFISMEHLNREYGSKEGIHRRMSDAKRVAIKPQLLHLYAKGAYLNNNTRLKKSSVFSDTMFINYLMENNVNEQILAEVVLDKSYLNEIKSEYNSLFSYKASDRVDVNEAIEDSMRTLDTWDQNKTNTNHRNSANLNTKLFLATLPMYRLNENGVYETFSESGLPVGVDYSNTFDILLNLGSRQNINSKKAFYEMLEAESKAIPEIASLMDRLNELNSYDNERLKKDYVDLENAIYTAFAKTSNNMRVIKIKNIREFDFQDRARTIGRANANELLNKTTHFIQSIYVGKQSDNPAVVEAAKTLERNFEKNVEQLKSFTERVAGREEAMKRKNDFFNVIGNIIDLLGIEEIVSVDNFKQIFERNGGKLTSSDIFKHFYNFTDSVFASLLSTNNKTIDIMGLQRGMNKEALNFGDRLNVYGNKLPSAMTTSAENKKIYTFGDKSFVEKAIQHVKGRDAEARNRFFEGILNDVTLENSFLKNQIFQKDGTIDHEFTQHLDIIMFTGIESHLNGNKDYKNINGYDKAYADLLLSMPNRWNDSTDYIYIPFATHFDSGTNNYLKVKKIKIGDEQITKTNEETKEVTHAIYDASAIDTSSEYFGAIRNSVQVELARMENAKKIIDHYNKTGEGNLYVNEHGRFNEKGKFITIENGRYIGNAFRFQFLTGMNELINQKTGYVDPLLITDEVIASELQKILNSNYKYIKRQDFDLKGYLKDADEMTFITKSLLNRYVYMQGIAELFSGQLSNYNGHLDFLQRNKFVGTIGINGAMDQAINFLVYHDPRYSSKIKDSYKKFLKKDYKKKGFDKDSINEKIESALKDYDNLESTDGQIFCIPEFYDTYQLNIGKQRTSMDMPANSMKPLIFSRVRDNNTTYSVGIKSSMFRLTEDMGGTYLDLLNFMRSNNIQMIIPVSAVKMGVNTQTVNLFSNESFDFLGNVEGADFSKNIRSFNMNDLMVQQELPLSHLDHTNKTSSQVLPLMIANTKDHYTYTINEKKYKGSEIKKMYNDIFNEIQLREKSKIYKALDIELNKEGKIKKFNRNKLFDLLSDELKNEGKAVINSLKSEILSKLPIHSNRLQSIIDSYISKKIIYPQLPGSHNIAVSDVLDPALTPKMQVNSKTGQNELIIPIKMPRWSKTLRDIDIENVSESARRMFMYRIPYSGKSLSVIAEVVGFAPDSAGSSVVVGRDMIARTGFDFDIDTFYFMQKKLRAEINKENGNTEVVPIESYFDVGNKKKLSEMSIDELHNSFVEMYEILLGSEHHFAESSTPAYYSDSVEIANNINEALSPVDNYPSYVSIETNTEYTKNVLSQKKLIGIVANSNTMLATLETLNAEIKGLALGYLDESGIAHELTKFNTEKSIGNKELTSDNVSKTLNHTADAVKKQMPVTFNKETATYVMTLMKLGVPYADAMYMIGQKSIYDYSNAMDRSQFVKSKSTESTIRKRFVKYASFLSEYFGTKTNGILEFYKEMQNQYNALNNNIIGKDKTIEQSKVKRVFTIVSEKPSLIKDFSINSKLYNEVNMKISNALSAQDFIINKLATTAPIKNFQLVDKKRFFETLHKTEFEKGEKYVYRLDISEFGENKYEVIKLDENESPSREDIVIKEKVSKLETDINPVLSFYDVRRTKFRLGAESIELQKNLSNVEFIENLIRYNMFQASALGNLVHFNKHIGAELRNLIPVLGLAKHKVNTTNQQKLREAIYSAKEGHIFSDSHSIADALFDTEVGNKVFREKYDAIELSNKLNEPTALDKNGNLSTLAYKFLQSFGYQVANNPIFEKRIKDYVFQNLFNQNIKEGIFNLTLDEKINLLGLKEIETSKLVSEHLENNTWDELPLAAKITSLKRSLINNEIFEKKHTLSYKFYNKGTSLLLNLDVQSGPISREMKDGIALIDLVLDIENVDTLNFMTDSFNDMLSLNGSILQGVAIDLIKYVYLTSGFTFSKNQLATVIDYTKLSKHGIKEIETTLNNIDNVGDFAYSNETLVESLASFILNNHRIFEFISEVDEIKAEHGAKKRQKEADALMAEHQALESRYKDEVITEEETKTNLLKEAEQQSKKTEDSTKSIVENADSLKNEKSLERYVYNHISRKRGLERDGFYRIPGKTSNDYGSYHYYAFFNEMLVELFPKGNSYIVEANINEPSLIEANNKNKTKEEIIASNEQLKNILKRELLYNVTDVFLKSDNFNKMFSNEFNDNLRDVFEKIFESKTVTKKRQSLFALAVIESYLGDRLTFANNIKDITFDNNSKKMTFEFVNKNDLSIEMTEALIADLTLRYNNENTKDIIEVDPTTNEVFIREDVRELQLESNKFTETDIVKDSEIANEQEIQTLEEWRKKNC